MADTTVATDVSDELDAIGLWGPYYTDVSTAIIVYIDFSGALSYARTTDKGANWSVTQIEGDAAIKSLSCWFDKETPGDTGDVVHIGWLDGSAVEAKYVTINVASDSVGTIRTVDSTVTIDALAFRSHTAITKTVNGNIIFAFSTQVEVECYKSSDNFATAGTDIADVFETGTEEDWVHLFPANVDAGDAAALFWDRSADEISVKMYDDSADTWTETSISGSMVDDTSFFNMDGVIRHSDSHLLMAAHSDADSAGDDILTWDITVDSIASPTVTAKANVVTNVAESFQIAMLINQQNDDVRCAYLKGGTVFATLDVVFHKSADGMGSWGTEQAYSEQAADDFRILHAGRTVGDDGGRYQPAFYEDGEVDIYVNETNDIEIAAAGGGAASLLPRYRHPTRHLIGR